MLWDLPNVKVTDAGGAKRNQNSVDRLVDRVADAHAPRLVRKRFVRCRLPERQAANRPALMLPQVCSADQAAVLPCGRPASRPRRAERLPASNTLIGLGHPMSPMLGGVPREARDPDSNPPVPEQTYHPQPTQVPASMSQPKRCRPAPQVNDRESRDARAIVRWTGRAAGSPSLQRTTDF